MNAPFYKIEMGIDSQIGQILEGFVVEPTMVGDEGRIFFKYGESHYFFKPSDVVGDPRESEWWRKAIYLTSAKNLREMVGVCAKAEDKPEVIELILANIVGQGYASKTEVGQASLPLERIRDILTRYTEEGLELPVPR
jgi:hypothetical protein